MLLEKFKDIVLQNGKSFKDYLQATLEKFSNQNVFADPHADSKFELRKLNYHRMSRIIKTYKINSELKSLIEKNISEYQLWLVITEDWCGDSAQILPYLAVMASQNPLINFKILERDSNLDFMDLYLTDGKSRSIPKLIVIDKDWNEVFQWGARPKAAQDYFLQLKSEGLAKDSINEKLQMWYNADKGKSLEAEFSEILTLINN
ncbi:MAG: thioredoxin family protein [bacterium]